MIALIFTVLGPSSIGVPDAFRIGVDLRPWAIVILLIVLMLELKDKLLARDEIEIARQVQLALLPEQRQRRVEHRAAARGRIRPRPARCGDRAP